MGKIIPIITLTGVKASIFFHQLGFERRKKNPTGVKASIKSN
jgi:hypothetical protein